MRDGDVIFPAEETVPTTSPQDTNVAMLRHRETARTAHHLEISAAHPDETTRTLGGNGMTDRLTVATMSSYRAGMTEGTITKTFLPQGAATTTAPTSATQTIETVETTTKMIVAAVAVDHSQFIVLLGLKVDLVFSRGSPSYGLMYTFL